MITWVRTKMRKLPTRKMVSIAVTGMLASVCILSFLFTINNRIGLKSSATQKKRRTFQLSRIHSKPKELNPHAPRMVDLQTFNDTVSQIKMSDLDLQNTYSLLHQFHLLMTKYKIEYIGYGGTILGAARHGGLIQWDDDADFVIMKNNTPTLFRAIGSQHILKLCYMNDNFYKVTFCNTSLAKDSNSYCAWPNLDLFLAHDMGSQMKVNFMGAYIYDKSSFFPSVVVPFGPLHLHFPRCFHQLARQDYGFNVCCTGPWNHRIETWAPRPACIHCDQLRDYFPFANFTKLNNSYSKLALKISEKVIREATVKMPMCDAVPVRFIKPDGYKPVASFH